MNLLRRSKKFVIWAVSCLLGGVLFGVGVELVRVEEEAVQKQSPIRAREPEAEFVKEGKDKYGNEEIDAAVQHWKEVQQEANCDSGR